MKRSIINAFLYSLIFVSTAFGATTATEEEGWLLTLFIGFGAMLIVFQLIPAVTLFLSMLKGLFAISTRKVALTEAEGRERSRS